MEKDHTLGYYRESRIWELDFIRGFCIWLMILDHTLYDLAFLFHSLWFGGKETGGFMYWLCETARTGYFPWFLRDIFWSVAVFCFIFICGISCSFSHSNLKRGLRLAVVALALTAFTYGIDWYMGTQNQFTIRFGILHMLAASILLYCLLQKFGKKAVLPVGFLAIALGIYFSYIPLKTTADCLAVLVHSTSGFRSADYFPLMPWLGFFLIGAFAGPRLYQNHRSFFPGLGKEGWMKPILFTGRHSLIFYLLHQPAVYVILTLTGMLFY